MQFSKLEKETLAATCDRYAVVAGPQLSSPEGATASPFAGDPQRSDMADEDDEWRFSVDEVGPDDEESDDPNGAESEGTAGESDGPAGEVRETAVENGDSVDGESDAWGVTVGEDRDGPTVTVGGPERAAEEVHEGIENGDGNVAGSLAPETAVERGAPEFENALFVGLGALVTIVVFVSLVEDDPVILGGVAAGTAVAMAGLYAFFTRV